MLKDLSADQFQGLVGSSFTVTAPGSESFEVQLHEVRLLEAHEGPRQQPFSALFIDARRTPPVRQQTFRVEHASLGVLELFLVPVGPVARGGMGYEAVFN